MERPVEGAVSASALARRAQLADAFATATPFGHVVIDDFLEPEFARRLLQQFPAFDRGDSRGEDGRPGAKSTFERVRALGDAYARLDDLVRSPVFLQLVGDICGIPGLTYDPWYLGGGTHENRDGASLDPHIDFNFHPLERWQRRLNLILYLNDTWQPDWGGALDLYEDPRRNDKPMQSVLPLFNRCVIFATHEHSWHGFRRITLPAEAAQQTRKSIALYFYTAPGTTAEAPAQAHSTVYVGRPLPAHLHAGHTLSESDIRELSDVVTEKDGRIAMQYAEIARLMTLVQAHERGIAGSALYLARRTWARLRKAR